MSPVDLEIHRVEIGALPLVNHLLGRLGFDDLMAAATGEPDRRCVIAPGRVIGILVRNLAVGRRPLYGISAWAAAHAPGLLGLEPGEAEVLNDDRVGRALDTLFTADRASLLTTLSVSTIRRFGLDVSELHNDTTSITLYGAYREATGAPRGGRRPPRPERGYSKDHRGDLKQLVENLTVTGRNDGTVPILHDLMNGSTEDSTTHIATWDALVRIVGHPRFAYVADCKLATRANMDHISSGGGQFLTVLPRSRREDPAGRAWIAAGGADWVEIARRSGRRKTDPDEIYWAVEAPTPSVEGYRIVWIRGSTKRDQDAGIRADRIDRARAGLADLVVKLASPRSQIRTLTAAESAAAAILTDTGAARWVRAKINETVEIEHRQTRRGRPGPNTSYRRVEHRRLTLAVTIDADAVAGDAATDGCFPFITNRDDPAADLLDMYKAQPHLERRHATFKGVLEAAPLTLKSDTRIDALGFCLYAALLVHALLERQLRRAMTAKKIDSLPLYYEHRACPAPTAARVFELLEPLAATTIAHHGQTIAVVPPALDPLQAQILKLLGLPRDAYRAATPALQP